MAWNYPRNICIFVMAPVPPQPRPAAGLLSRIFVHAIVSSTTELLGYRVAEPVDPFLWEGLLAMGAVGLDDGSDRGLVSGPFQ